MTGPAHRAIGSILAAYVALPPLLADPSPERAVATGCLIAAGPVLGHIADIDQKIDGLPHRGPTHSLLVALALAAGLASLVGAHWPQLAMTVFWATALPLASHSQLDRVNTTPVAALWPLPELLAAVGLRSVSVVLRMLSGAPILGIHQSTRGHASRLEWAVEWSAGAGIVAFLVLAWPGYGPPLAVQHVEALLCSGLVR